MKKVVRLTENDLANIVKRVILEQKKFNLVVNQGSRAQGEIKGNLMTITTEGGQVQRFIVKTALPQGRFMFEYGKDGQYYGYDGNGKKIQIYILGQK